jgi:hypothetical protein
MALFWSDAAVDPKRRFRYKFQIGQLGQYFVKTANMPKVTVSTIEHSFLDYNFKFPGRVTWDPISITLVAPTGGTEEDPSNLLVEWLEHAGYVNPDSADTDVSLGKLGFQDAFGGDPMLLLIDGDGMPAEEWILRNAFLTSVDWGGSLDYTSDEMLELTMEIAYDWAEKTL